MDEPEISPRGREALRSLIGALARAAAQDFFRQRDLGRIPSARKVRRSSVSVPLLDRLSTEQTDQTS